MTHCQIFYPFDNEDGYISVVCHRERFLENLLSLGWQKTAAEAVAVRDGLRGKVEKSTVKDSFTVGEEPVCAGEPTALVHQGPEADGYRDTVSDSSLSAKQRKKLSLKK